MRVPVQAPALLRYQRSRLVRPFGRRHAEADGVHPSQYDGGGEGEAVEEDQGSDTGEEGGGEGDSSVEAE